MVVSNYPQIETANIDPDKHILWSVDYEDSYYNSSNPIGERQHVFINGLDLENRFKTLKDNQSFVMGETRFGAGLTFLLTAAIFLKNANKDSRLIWVSSELHPLKKNDLNKLYSTLKLSKQEQKLAQWLVSVWPEPICGGHRRFYPGGSIQLDLHYGNAVSIFGQLLGIMDAWCLDGFVPNRNPDIWDKTLFQQIARLSRPGTRVATFSVAKQVRENLIDVGFEVIKKEGFGNKKSRLEAVFVDSFNPSIIKAQMRYQKKITNVTIVGAGLSGALIASGLVRRGIGVQVIDELEIASGASQNPQAIAYGKPSSILSVYGLLQLCGLGHLETAYEYGCDSSWNQTGLLVLAQNDKVKLVQQKLINSLKPASKFFQLVNKNQASDIAGVKVSSGGLFFANSGWLNIKTACQQIFSLPEVTSIRGKVTHLIPVEENKWQIIIQIGHKKKKILVDNLILCNSLGIMKFSTNHIPLIPLKGQYTRIKTELSLKVPVTGQGYIAPPVNGEAILGSTFERNFENLKSDIVSDFMNIKRIKSLFQNPNILDKKNIVCGQASVRASTPDRLPIAGWINYKSESFTDNPDYSKHGFFANTGLRSKGTVIAPITAELIISDLLNEPSLLPKNVRDSISPNRFRK